MRVHTQTIIEIHTGEILSDSFFEYSGPIALCDRAATGEAKNAQGQAGATASGLGTQASQISGTLVPTLSREATNPTGFSPTDQNAMLVASEQGAGGAASGITGEAGLNAMRTHNTGALSSVYDQAARRKSQTESQNALGVQNENAQLKQKQQQAGLTGLEGLYGTDVANQLKAMGVQDEDINTQINAGKSGWLQNTLDAAKTAGQVAGAFAGG